MKKSNALKITLLVVASLIFLSRCAKDTTEPEDTDPTPVVTPAAFKWTPDGKSSVSADESYYIPAYNNIVAIKNGAGSVDIVLENLSIGSHTLSSSSGVTLEYSDGTTTYASKSGVVNITTSGSSLAGTFKCVLTGGSVTGISGEFSNLKEKK